MVILLTISLVMVGLGLTLLALTLASPQSGLSEATATTPPGLDAPAGRRLRPIPLVLGLLLTAVGGVLAIVISLGNADDYDRLVLRYWPANSLVDDLDSEDAKRRSDAYGELNRRYSEGSLSQGAHRRLAARMIALETGDREHPESPMFGLGLVPQIDLIEARQQNILSAKQWASFIARSTPLRLDAARRLAQGESLEMRLDISLQDPEAPGWVVVAVEGLTLGGTRIETPVPMAVAPNPEWERPPPPPEPAGDGSPGSIELGGGGQNRAPVRRVVRVPYSVAADSLRDLGPGRHSLGGTIHVFAFDSDEIAPPLELMSGEMTDVPRRQQASDDLIPAVLAAKLTPEQLEQFKQKAHATHQWTVRGTVQIGDAQTAGSGQSAPQQQPPSTQPSERPGGDGAASGGE